MMKKLLIGGVVAVMMVLGLGAALSYAWSGNFQLNMSELLSESGNEITDKLKPEYALSYAVQSEDEELKREIESLTKKTTYLLFGDPNEENEPIENFYKRKKDWRALRYAPEVPKDENGLFGLDTNSQEYQDDLVSGMTIPQVFSQASEMGLKYNTYGDIQVTMNGDVMMSTIVLPQVRLKVQSADDPMKYVYEETDFVMHYFYKKLGDEWKLYYAYGESTDDVEEYTQEIEMTGALGMMAVAPVYESQISTIYNFDKLNSLSQGTLDAIYRNNVQSIVYLESFYNNAVVGAANGFYIGDGLVVTTWGFLEKALTKAQYIVARDSAAQALEVEGIVTLNPEMDLVVLKVKTTGNQVVKLGDDVAVAPEDPAIVLSSKTGVGVLMQKGIVLTNDGYIQTSIPLAETDAGSPLFNQAGEVIGINTAKAAGSSISWAVSEGALKEVQKVFGGVEHAKIEAVPFSELKESYYTSYGGEEVVNTIPEKVWREYAQIGKIEETIGLELVKASSKNGIVSLRYKNGIANYVGSMQLAAGFREELEREGYKKISENGTKVVYQNGKYQVILMDEFNYLIVLMVRL